MFHRACSMRAAGLDAAAIVAALLDENFARCAPPLPEHEVESIARKAATYPAGFSKSFQEERDRGERSVTLAARFGRRSA